MARYSLPVDPKSELHRNLLKRVCSRLTLARRDQQDRWNKWQKAEERVLAYIPESEADAIRRNKRETEGEPRYTTIMIPYTFALLMSAHTYWTSVFFARSPVHQFYGLHGESEMQTQALDALVSYQVEVGEMLAPYYIWLYDAGKYGHGVLGEYWCEEMIHYGELVEMEGQLYQATHEVEGYRGNRNYNISPYDFMHDPRVPLSRFQDGEFCVVIRRLGWSKILERQQQGYFINVDKLKEHTSVDRNANEGSSQLKRPDFSRQNYYDSVDEKHPAGGVFFEVYINLVPAEWGLGDSKYMQKWCITLTEDEGLIVGASPLNHIHGQFPFSVLESEVEGYGLYNRGIPEIMEGVQNTMDWLINTHFFNVRSSLNNQFIVDPSKLVLDDVANSHEPGFIWRLRPEAYGQDIRSMFHQIPVTDVTRNHFGDVQGMLQIGERALGINDQIMGALSGNARRTATEVRTTTSFGVNRQKTITEYMSATGFSSHARRLVQNSQQFYRWDTKMRIVGDLAQLAGPQFMQVTPDLISGYYLPLPVDGTLPIDRMAQANLWKEIMMGLTRMPPQITAGFDIMKMFSWMASLGGLKNINQMKIQTLPNEQLAQQAAAGNVVPIGRGAPSSPSPGRGSPDASTVAGLNALLPSPAAGATNGGQGY